MNIVFLILSLAGLAVLTFTNPERVFPTMISGAQEAVELSLKLLAVYSVWMSVLKLMEQTGLDKKLSRLLKPLTKRLFKGESDEAHTYISINLASNMLGMGGAATPAGINAMKLMDKGGERISANMSLLVVITSSSIQLIPATVIALRAQGGSSTPADIFLPTLIATFSSTVIAIILCKVFSRK